MSTRPSPDAVPDKNVFDIQQGVALIIAMRKSASRKELAEVWHGDLWGSRRAKYQTLHELDRTSDAFSALDLRAPRFELGHRDHELEAKYRDGFAIEELQPVNSIGIVTGADWKLVAGAKSPEIDQQAIGETFDSSLEQALSYRPFERARLYYDPKLIERDRFDVMRHYTSDAPNLGLLTTKAHRDAEFAHVFVTPTLSEAIFLSGTTASNAMNFPLFLYPDESAGQTDALAPTERTTNFDPKLYAAICKAAGIHPADKAGPEDDFRAMTGEARPSEVKVFDYIYGVLHSPAYRETFAEFLKIDFPRIPYPPSPEVFRHVSEKGEQLRRLHLMEPAAIGETPYPYHGEGDDVVAKGYPKWERSGTPDRVRGDEGGAEEPDRTEAVTPASEPGSRFPLGRIHVNKDQYFEGVPEIAWNFHIGGYQPAQKWLKDRRGRTLSWDDIGHYQKIVKILAETHRIMQEIELPLDA